MTVYGVATALMRNPEAVAAMKEADWEIASHGLKWIDYRDFSAEEERAHLGEAIRIHTEMTGSVRSAGIPGRLEHTNRLVAGGGRFPLQRRFLCRRIALLGGSRRRQAAADRSYTLDANDMRFGTPQGFNSGDQFFAYLKDSFDTLYEEGETAPKMLSVGLHCRLVGRPGRAAALARFLDYVASHENVWIAKRIDIARHWIRRHRPADVRPSTMSRVLFVSFSATSSSIRLGSPRTYDAGLTTGQDTAEGLHAAMVRVLSEASTEQNLRSSTRIPILPGASSSPTSPPDSRGEQTSAGLDTLTAEERDQFLKLNDSYKQKFGFPFIMAVKGRSKDEILAAFEERLDHEGPRVRGRHRADRVDRAAPAQGAPAVARRCLLESGLIGTVGTTTRLHHSLAIVSQVAKRRTTRVCSSSSKRRAPRSLAEAPPQQLPRSCSRRFRVMASMRPSSGSRSRATR